MRAHNLSEGPDRTNSVILGGGRMKNLFVALALASVCIPSLSQAQVKLDMSKVTCGEALAMPPEDQADFGAFVSGWFAQKAGRTFIDLDLFRKNTASVMSWCKSNPSDSVMAAIERAVGQK
jgi:HdeA/HdeB family